MVTVNSSGSNSTLGPAEVPYIRRAGDCHKEIIHLVVIFNFVKLFTIQSGEVTFCFFHIYLNFQKFALVFLFSSYPKIGQKSSKGFEISAKNRKVYTFLKIYKLFRVKKWDYTPNC